MSQHFGLLLVLLLLLATVGAPLAGQAAEIRNPIAAENFQSIIARIADWAVAIAASLTTLVVLWAGYLYLLGGASEDNVKRAKSAITWAVVGFIVVLVSASVSALIKNVLGGASGSAPTPRQEELHL